MGNKNYYSDNNRQTYVGAPYNFISFNKNVVPVDSQRMTNHNLISEELLTGEIEYTVKSETDIFVDDGKQEFYKNAKGEYSIPGSTMRGLIRNNVQILGLSSFAEDIDDYRLMYRNIAQGAEKEFYNTVLGSKQISTGNGNKHGVLTNVKAGYIVKKGSKYKIYKTTVDKISNELGEMNYYVISEKNIANNLNNYPFLKENKRILQHDVTKGFRREVFKGKVQNKGVKNFDYKPGYYEVSYEVKDKKIISRLGNPGQFSNKGYLVATGPMNDKKVLYVIPGIDFQKELEVPEQDVLSFKIDFEHKKNTIKRFHNDDFFNLPKKENEYKPVFYVELEGKLYFGFTPRLRLFYEHSVKEGYLQTQEDFDYAKSIFGCIGKDKTGYKSKVSFSDAVISTEATKGQPAKLILAEPKPTSYLDYVKQQNNKPTTYNTDGFELRGTKQYWLHNTIQNTGSGENDKVASVINPIKSGALFHGKIRFQNLTKDELGLLVWGIKLNDNSRMNVGKAKAFGYGVISVSDIKVRTVNLEKAYSCSLDFELNPMEEADLTELIEIYKNSVNSKLCGKKIDELLSIREFFAMKDSTKIPDNKDIRYMKLGGKGEDREYQSRKKPLETVIDTIKKGNVNK